MLQTLQISYESGFFSYDITQGSGINKTDTGTSCQEDFPNENSQGKQNFLLLLYEMVREHQTWEKVFQIFAHILQ